MFNKENNKPTDEIELNFDDIEDESNGSIMSENEFNELNKDAFNADNLFEDFDE